MATGRVFRILGRGGVLRVENARVMRVMQSPASFLTVPSYSRHHCDTMAAPFADGRAFELERLDDAADTAAVLLSKIHNRPMFRARVSGFEPFCEVVIVNETVMFDKFEERLLGRLSDYNTGCVKERGCHTHNHKVLSV